MDGLTCQFGGGKMTEKLYLITYECMIEPLYSRTAQFSVGENAQDAIQKLFPTEKERKEHLILETKEFTIPGYKINLEKLVG